MCDQNPRRVVLGLSERGCPETSPREGSVNGLSNSLTAFFPHETSPSVRMRRELFFTCLNARLSAAGFPRPSSWRNFILLSFFMRGLIIFCVSSSGEMTRSSVFFGSSCVIKASIVWIIVFGSFDVVMIMEIIEVPCSFFLSVLLFYPR